MSYGIKILSLADGTPHPYAGRWVSHFDPDGIPGQYPSATIDASESPAEALRFDDAGAAMLCWKRRSKTRPNRPTDGKPNRPMTALTVEIAPLP